MGRDDEEARSRQRGGGRSSDRKAAGMIFSVPVCGDIPYGSRHSNVQSIRHATKYDRSARAATAPKDELIGSQRRNQATAHRTDDGKAGPTGSAHSHCPPAGGSMRVNSPLLHRCRTRPRPSCMAKPLTLQTSLRSGSRARLCLAVTLPGVSTMTRVPPWRHHSLLEAGCQPFYRIRGG